MNRHSIRSSGRETGRRNFRRLACSTAAVALAAFITRACPRLPGHGTDAFSLALMAPDGQAPPAPLPLIPDPDLIT